jgi:hypothetical protein
MKNALIAGVLLATLAACGGRSDRAERMTQPVAFAKGPIGNACMAGGRQSASRALCGCVQAAADLTLSGSDQRRGAKFFTDSQAVQDMQLDDSRFAEEFWDRWQAFSELAETMCRGA